MLATPPLLHARRPPTARLADFLPRICHTNWGLRRGAHSAFVRALDRENVR